MFPQVETDTRHSGLDAGGSYCRETDFFLESALEQLDASLPLVDRAMTASTVRRWLAETRSRLGRKIDGLPLVSRRQCRAGCSWCCHTITTDVTAPEAILLAEDLRQRHAPKELSEIRCRLARADAYRKEMLPAERRWRRVRCGLLDDTERCVAYRVRPLACLGAFSFSAARCESAYRGESDPQGKSGMDEAAKTCTRGVSAALQRTLALTGLDGNLYELNSAVLGILEIPDAFERWLGGEDLFADCLCSDPHSPPRVKRSLKKTTPD